MVKGISDKTSVYILTGQSNSLGTTCLEGSDYYPPESAFDRKVRFFWSNVDESSTGHPPKLYGSSEGKFSPLQMQQGGRENPHFWGPEFGFARSICEADMHRLVIIKASRGGGGNSYWHKQAYLEDAGRGHMWGHLCATLDQSLSSLHNNCENFLIRGLLYIQGESNSSSEAMIADTRLGELIDDLTVWLEQKYPKCTSGMRTVVGEIAASKSSHERIQTTRLQAALAEVRSDLKFVFTNDLDLKTDALHFGRDAKLEIGRRMAVAMQA